MMVTSDYSLFDVVLGYIQGFVFMARCYIKRRKNVTVFLYITYLLYLISEENYALWIFFLKKLLALIYMQL